MLNPSQACKLFGYSALASNSCLPQWSYMQAAMSDLSSAGLLSVPRPATWPPPLNDGHSQHRFMASLQKAKTSDAGWTYGSAFVGKRPS